MDGRGHVVGINTAVAGVGLGLAVPINAATRTIVGALMSEGAPACLSRHRARPETAPAAARPDARAQLGGRDRRDRRRQPCRRRRLRPEDLILEVDGSPVESVNDLQRHMVGDVIGRTVRVTVHRSGQTFDVDIVPVELDV